MPPPSQKQKQTIASILLLDGGGVTVGGVRVLIPGGRVGGFSVGASVLGGAGVEYGGAWVVPCVEGLDGLHPRTSNLKTELVMECVNF